MVKFEDLDLDRIVEEVLGGAELDRETAAAILNCPDERLNDLLGATLKVREASFARRVKLCMLRNARSGICPEDCGYCSQSKLSKADIPVYKLQSVERLMEGADRAAQAGARRYCMVTSGRGPDARDIEHLGEACERIRDGFPGLEICLSLGLMERDQADTLKLAGAGWINHNLNTSRRFYPQICTTHTWDDRVRTIENVRAAGLATCSGGIVGMGESDEDLLDLAYATRRLKIDSVPVNFLNSIKATPLETQHNLTPAAMPQGDLPVSIAKSQERGSRRRRTRTQPRRPSGLRAVRGQFDLYRWLPHDSRSGRGRHPRDDRAHGV